MSDIIGGFVLATLVVLPCFISWAGQLAWFAARLAALAQQDSGPAHHQLSGGMSAATDGKRKLVHADIEQGKGVDDAALPKVAVEGPAGSLTHGSGAALPPNGSSASSGLRQ